MNNLPKWKQKIIELLAGNEPVILNFAILPKNLPCQMKGVVIIPAAGWKQTSDSWSNIAFLVPSRNVDDSNPDTVTITTRY